MSAEITRPDDVLNAAPTRRLLDFDQPIGLLANAIGHFIGPDADLSSVFAHHRNALPSGSFFALSHLSDDFAGLHGDQIVNAMKSSRDNVFLRTREEALELFTGYEFVEPGLVTTSSWRPVDEGTHEQDGLYAGVGQRL